MKGLSRRQFFKISAAVVATALVDRYAGARGGFSVLNPSDVHANPLAALLPTPTPGVIKSETIDFSGRALRQGELSGLALDGNKLTLSSWSSGVFTSEIIEAPLPFGAVGPRWSADVPAGANIMTQIRVSSDGREWTDWQTVELESPPDHITAPGYIGSLVTGLTDLELNRYAQYRLVFTTDDATAWTQPALSSLSLTFIDATDGPTTNDALRSQSLTLNDLQTMGPAHPGMLSRAAWGCPTGQNSPAWPWAYRRVTHLSIHNTASDNGITDWTTHVRNIWHYHAVTCDWGDIGYNFLIDPNGIIFEGRAGGDDVIAGHAYGFNAGTMGVGCLGTYTYIGANSLMQNALQNLLAWKCGQRDIDPQATKPIVGYEGCNPATFYLPTILGHRDYPGHSAANPNGCWNQFTTCPGDGLRNQISGIRANVANKLQPQDTTPPNATMGALPQFTVNTLFTVSWSASDPSGIKRYEVQHRIRDIYSNLTDWSLWRSVSGSQTSDVFSGQRNIYYFRCRAVDNCDNVGPWSPEVSIAVDPTAPDCGMDAPLDCARISATDYSANHTWFVVKVWGWDWPSEVKNFDIECRDGSSNWRSFVTGLTGTKEGDRTYAAAIFEGQAGHVYTFRCRARDNAGNLSNWSGVSGREILVTAGHDSSGLHRTYLPLITKNW